MNLIFIAAVIHNTCTNIIILDAFQQQPDWSVCCMPPWYVYIQVDVSAVACVSNAMCACSVHQVTVHKYVITT